MQIDYEDVARYALDKIENIGYDVILHDPPKTVSQPRDQLIYFLALFMEERMEQIVQGWLDDNGLRS